MCIRDSPSPFSLDLRPGSLGLKYQTQTEIIVTVARRVEVTIRHTTKPSIRNGCESEINRFHSRSVSHLNEMA